MKLKTVLAAIAPFLATDKKPDEVLAAVLAADKKAKDAAGSGLGSRELEETDTRDKAAKDRKAAHDKARDKMNANDKKAFDAMSDEEKDKVAQDRDDDPEHTNDEELEGEDEDLSDGNPSTPGGSRAGGKTAIDSAEVDRRIARAVGARDALHVALREVEPIIGVQTFDSAGKAYRAALDHLKVDTKGIPDSALPAMLRLVKDRAAPTAPPAMDSATVSGLEKIIPGYGRLR
jgi:hypothetical protein